MDNSVILVLIGGLISLVSALATIALQHWFDLRKQEHETRRYPAEILFNKQTEFYDKTANILPEINGYITTVDVWLRETTPDAKQKVKQFAEATAPVWEFNELIEAYSIYLPEKILRAGNELFAECIFVSNSPTLEGTYRCTNLLFSFQNTIRQCVGTDKISTDLLRAFGMREWEKTRRGSDQ
jgi:hypothetical protein